MTREPPPSFTAPADAVTLPVRISQLMANKMAEHARSLGYKPVQYATMLLEAAWSARCGNADDPALSKAVSASEKRRA